MPKSIDLSYKNCFFARGDGRYVITAAAAMDFFRGRSGDLSLPRKLTAESFEDWKNAVKRRLSAQLALPEAAQCEPPVKLYGRRRDGYRAEKWEFYPDRYTAVPFFALIPRGAKKSAPAPVVICFADVGHSKEFSAGEPEIDHPNCRDRDRRESERMALQLVRAGYGVFVFDAPGDGECSVMSDPGAGVTEHYLREVLCHGLLEMNASFAALTVYQRLSFLKYMSAFPWADEERIGFCAQGAGAESALFAALLCEKVKCLVYNDVLTDNALRFSAVTESDNEKMQNEVPKWRVIPGMMRDYGLADLCAAFAPRYLALCEGGPDCLTDKVRRAYAACGAKDRLQISYYPKYASRKKRGESTAVPKYGLDLAALEKLSYIDGVKRRFRADLAIKLFNKALGPTAGGADNV